MAVDKRGRKLPKGIQQRYDGFEARPMIDGKRYLVRGNTVGECQKAVTELKYKLETGMYIEKSKVTLSEWFITWMDTYKKNTLKRSTFIVYGDYFDRHVKGTLLGDTMITNIRAEHVQKLYNSLVEDGYSLSAIKQIKATIYGSLEQAVKNGMIERNPVKLVDLPKIEIEKERVVMTKEQQELFMQYAEDSYLYNMFQVMLRTGMRVGEAQALKTSDINKKKGVIHVTKTLKYDKEHGFYETTPKTKTSIRDIPVPAATMKFLDNQRKFWGFKVESLDRYLFIDETGQPLQRERIRTEIRRIIRVIIRDGHKFPGVTPHTFRHTFATRAIEHGMQPQILKTILGHASLAMTMDLYSHVLPETRSEAMEKIASAF